MTFARTRILACVLALTACVGLRARAQDSEPIVAIHGAGGAIFGVTNSPNAYLGGTPDRSLDLHEFSLTAMATPDERLLIGAQVFWGVRTVHKPHDPELGLKMAFAQYKVSDKLKVRAGLSRQPFGIYSETLEVGTLRPFLHLPQSIYTAAVQEAEGYLGVGITGFHELGRDWSLDYDLYGGEILWAAPTDVNPVVAELGGPASPPRWKDSIGARLRVSTPLNGLRLGFAAASGTPREPFVGQPIRRNVEAIASLDFVRGRWDLKSEWALRSIGGDLGTGYSGYVDLAYHATRRWQIAARWDRYYFSIKPGTYLPPFLHSFNHSSELALGIAFQPTNGMVFKASYHDVYGNFIAVPIGGVDFAHGGTLDPHTRLIEAGVQFAF